MHVRQAGRQAGRQSRDRRKVNIFFVACLTVLLNIRTHTLKPSVTIFCCLSTYLSSHPPGLS